MNISCDFSLVKSINIPVPLQDAGSEAQSNFTSRRINEVMVFPYKLVLQRSDVALCFPLGGL